jgi:predicted transcriptional regulator
MVSRDACIRHVRRLEKNGYITEIDNGYHLTEAGDVWYNS